MSVVLQKLDFSVIYSPKFKSVYACACVFELKEKAKQEGNIGERGEKVERGIKKEGAKVERNGRKEERKNERMNAQIQFVLVLVFTIKCV